MDALAARTFVIAFLLVYAGLLVALVGWGLRKWLGGGHRKRPPARRDRNSHNSPALRHSDRAP